MRQRLRAFLRLKRGASWKKGHLLQSVLIVVLLSCHHPLEHRQSNCNHYNAKADEDYQFVSYLWDTSAKYHDFS